ncbi:MAG: Fic family protein [Verrucomicrobia bacterium]|nr:Fic family protein [Verrucomicrobiota bacterium]
MRIPQSPPDVKELMVTEPNLFEKIEKVLLVPEQGNYYHWDEIRHRTPPEGLTHEEWWAAIKIGRWRNAKQIPLQDKKGLPFQFSVPGAVAQQLHEIDMGAGGRIGMPSPVTNSQIRDQYLVSSLIREAITSSQLEGAVTTREVAKEMIRTARPPRDRSERMILNNYLTMREIITLREKPLTEEMVFHIHRMVTDGTLDKPDAGGRFRRADETVTVEDDTGTIFHHPPKADELPERMAKMCAFANGEPSGNFIHPAIRGMLLHFWLAYDHPFLDGNGRTARAIFYWSMLHHGYWLFEFVSISDILHRAPAKYYSAFLHTETDDNDATYFLVHQAEVIRRAILQLHAYIDRKTKELEESQQLLRGCGNLNHRQIAILGHAMRHPGTIYTIEGHQRSHNTAYDTARRDLLTLAKKDLLSMRKRGKAMVFSAISDLQEKLKRQETNHP